MSSKSPAICPLDIGDSWSMFNFFLDHGFLKQVLLVWKSRLISYQHNDNTGDQYRKIRTGSAYSRLSVHWAVVTYYQE